jgi:large subunit ribosomal protein L29
MTTKRARELREFGEEELSDQLVESRTELFNLRFQHVTGQLDNYSRLGDLKRDVARMHTLLREREIAAAEGTGAAAVRSPTSGTPKAAAAPPAATPKAAADPAAQADEQASEVES